MSIPTTTDFAENPYEKKPDHGLDTEFKRGLGLFDATMVVVGSMIGSGIFLVSADMGRLIGQEMLIGLSTHSTAEFDAGAAEADYLCAGPLYATPTKPGRPATGLDIVTHAARRQREAIQ